MTPVTIRPTGKVKVAVLADQLFLTAYPMLKNTAEHTCQRGPFMKFLTSFFVAALCISTCGIAQTTSGSTTDATTSSSTSTVVGSMTVTTTVPYTVTTSGSTAIGTYDASKPTKGTRATFEIFILRSGTGQVEYGLNVTSIRLDDPDHLSDGIGTQDLFSFFGREAVRQGVALGYTPTSSTCNGTVQGTVSAEYYVTRTGTGSDTRFYPYDTQTKVYRGYSACQESGSVSPTVSLVATAVKTTSTTYDSTIQ
jgi:hypothetical protein